MQGKSFVTGEDRVEDLVVGAPDFVLRGGSGGSLAAVVAGPELVEDMQEECQDRVGRELGELGVKREIGRAHV